MKVILFFGIMAVLVQNISGQISGCQPSKFDPHQCDWDISLIFWKITFAIQYSRLYDLFWSGRFHLQLAWILFKYGQFLIITYLLLKKASTWILKVGPPLKNYIVKGCLLLKSISLDGKSNLPRHKAMHIYITSKIFLCRHKLQDMLETRLWWNSNQN